MEQFLRVRKILPHPREFDHHFLPRGRELDKKICPGGRDSLAQINFPGGCPGVMYPVGIDWDITVNIILLYSEVISSFLRSEAL